MRRPICESRMISSKSNIHFKSICSDSNSNAGGVSAEPEKPQEHNVSIRCKSDSGRYACSLGRQEGKAEDNMLMLRDKVDTETEGLVTNVRQLGKRHTI